MPSKVTIQNGQWQDAAGNTITGTLNLQLSQDAVVTGTGTIAPVTVSIVVTAGQAVATPIWGNDNLTPSGTVYIARLFDTSGALVWGPENWSLTGAGPIELNTLTPASSSVSYSGAVVLTPSADQTITVDNVLPAAGNTTQSLGSSAAPWNAVLNTAQAKSFENVLVATEFSGSDIGAQINAAYAALPASGGRILIPCKSDGTAYNFSTPIVLSTGGKYVCLEGVGSGGAQSTSSIGGTILNFTGTSGTAITLDYVVFTISPLSATHGIRNLTIVNNNHLTTGSYTGTAVGIACGNTNQGCYGATMENVGVIGFNTGFLNTNNHSVQICWINPQFFSNNIAIQLEAITGFWIFGGQICGNVTAIKANSAAATPEIQLFGTQFFSNTGTVIDFTALNGSGSYASLDGFSLHFEAANNTPHFIDGAIDTYLSGGVAEDDTANVTRDWMFNAVGRKFIIDGMRFACGLSSTITTILVANSPVRGRIAGFLNSPGHFTNYVTGANSGKITIQMFSGQSTVAATDWTFESRLGAPAILINSEAVSAAPRGLYSTYIRLTTAAGTFSRVTLDKAITITRVQVMVGGTVGSGQTTAAVVRVTDGTTNTDTTLTNSTGVFDSGAISVNVAASSNLDIKIATASSGGTAPTDVTVCVQYRMQ